MVIQGHSLRSQSTAQAAAPNSRRSPMSDKEITLKPGWLKRQVDRAAEDVKRMTGGQTMNEATSDNFGLSERAKNIAIGFFLIGPAILRMDRLHP
jgi:hypothetical protein